MTRTAGALIGRRRSSAFWGLGCPKTHHEIKDSLVGIFSTRVKVENDQTPVKMIAVDKKGQHTSLEFLLIPKMRNVTQPEIVPDKPFDPLAATKRLVGQVDFGQYHALSAKEG
ncbi:MAG: hypothetical protein ABW170_20255 [Candidatus Thiodiazotropha sp. L084R]